MNIKNRIIAVFAIIIGFILSFSVLILKRDLMFPDGNLIVSSGFFTLQGIYFSLVIFSSLMIIKFIIELKRGIASFSLSDGIGTFFLIFTVLVEIYFYTNTSRASSFYFLQFPMIMSLIILLIGILGYKAEKSTLCIGLISLSAPLFVFPFAVIILITLHFGV
jgi:hypothetical protein